MSTPTIREVAAGHIAEAVEGPREAYAHMVDLLIDIWLLDAELGINTASQPWVAGMRQAGDFQRKRNRGGDRRFLEDLHALASEDVELARIVVSAPWYIDGVSYSESINLRFLAGVATEDIELASLIANFSWYSTGVSGKWSDSFPIRAWNEIALADIDLAMELARRWSSTSVPNANTLWSLKDLMSIDMELAKQVVELSWLADGATEIEEVAVRLLSELAETDVELVRTLVKNSWLKEDGTLTGYVISSLKTLHRRSGKNVTDKLTSQPWFVDGLDEEEAVFVSILGWARSQSTELYEDLLSNHYTQHRAISFPLAGEVDIWILQNTPYPADEDLLTVIEETVGVSEQLLRVSIPTNNIILLVVEDIEGRYGFSRAKHLSSFMVATRRSDGVRSVRHETAHYYTDSGLTWLTEGMAEFIVAFVKDRTGLQSMKDRGTEVSQEVQSLCVEFGGIENIRQLTYIWGNDDPYCAYVMGENLLLEVLDTFGEEVLSSVLGELTILMLEGELSHGSHLEQEALVFNTFAKHIPKEKMEDFLALYRKLHGGPYNDLGLEFMDDHSDEAAAATEIVVDTVAEGSLDYYYDFDYFKFRAEAGQRYIVNVDHESLRSSSLLLYSPDGLEFESYLDRARVSSVLQLRWVAPVSGEYFFAIHNFGGYSGSYTATVTSVSPVPDDHGDSADTATDISLGEVVGGTIDHVFDFDFFRIQVEPGREYEFDTEGLTLEFARADLYESDGITWTKISAADWERRFGSWTAAGSGEYYLAVHGGYGKIGTYRLFVSPYRF